MRRVSDGYTIIEVMIFLAISLVIAASSWSLISGKQAETEFNQKMRDTQSKIQDWINDVSTGFTGGDPSQQSCTISAIHRPQLQTGGPSSTPNCIFLGKAIQFTDPSYSGTPNQDEELYTYSIFGCRLAGCPNPPGPNANLPTDTLSSNPKAADGISGLDLTETFSLSPANVKWVCSALSCLSMPPQPLQSHLIGFFNSPDPGQSPSSSNGAEDLNVYQFPFNGQDAKNGTTVDKCLELLAPGPCSLPPGITDPTVLKNFVVCLTDGKHTAEISITSNSGVSPQTNLTYTSC